VAEARRLHLFEGFGIELEYMIVDRVSLDVRPISDRILRDASQQIVSELERGDIAWSNELVLHVIELKTNGPAPALEGLGDGFARSTSEIRSRLEPEAATILGTGMHPWMDPFREMKLWPHEYNAVYEAFDRIFDCRGHGWANLQSMHINLPFADDREFRRLHAAIRLLLPIMPALAASSPIADGHPTGHLDHRMEVYRTNAKKIPSMTGKIVPEPIASHAEYEEKILGRIYRDLEPYDPDGVLQDEFANARGAIARFDRSAIEIRVLDVQECPKADIAIAAAIVSVLRATIDETDGAWPVDPLAAILDRVVRDGDEAVIDDRAYLDAFGLSRRTATPRDLWRHLLDRAPPASEHAPALSTILGDGPLARRMLRRLPPSPSREDLLALYRALTACLASNALLG
jgi:gamma-glutamyl:cysteine ligase YbdK (ATP-grasp superfamily)